MKISKGLSIVLLFSVLLAVFLTYLNHFDNSFHFDDSHVIETNLYIRDLGNAGKFFTDATTFSSLPANQMYRPLITLSNAWDYYMAGGKLDPFYFHISNFIFYILQLVLMYFFILGIFRKTEFKEDLRLPAIVAVAFYGLHPVSAETINYISARSDSFSTFFILLSFILYQYSNVSRKYFLYLLPMLAGILIKPTGLMLAPLLFVYIALIEKDIKLLRVFRKTEFTGLLRSLLIIIPALLLSVILYIFQDKMTPESFLPSQTSLYNYVITQPYVFLLYFSAFFYPAHLSADTDLRAFESITDPRFFIGLAFIITLLIIGFLCSKRKQSQPIAFGIFWFFLALLPSSSIIPFAEVMNDHRMFFPFVGLMISVVWAAYLLRSRIRAKAVRNFVIPTFLIILATLCIKTTHQRNEVWDNEESLWKDVTIKSPENGRGWMNYGLTHMEQGHFDKALECYEKSLGINPYYSYLHINIGIAKSATGQFKDAEQYFKNALQYGANYHGSYYYYGRFLYEQGRITEAIPMIEAALQISPAFVDARYLLMEAYAKLYKWEKLEQLCNETLQIIPGDQTSLYYIEQSGLKQTRLETAIALCASTPTEDNYLNLSLEYYLVSDYQACIHAAEEALKVNPASAIAWNNICSAYNQLGMYDKAIVAGENALVIDPNMELARNNLNFARQMWEN